jgi:ABC-type dipeptide/oligopeptide/nickel transport system permease component
MLLYQGLLYGCAVFVFFLVLYLGSIPTRGEDILCRDFAPRFWKEGYRSIALIFPALVATIFLAACLGVITWSGGICRQYLLSPGRKPIPARAGCVLWATVCHLGSFLSSLVSAVPPFIVGIFLIRLLRLDTVYGQNLAYGILCLAAFNVNYFYKRVRQKMVEAYSAPDVQFARSLGFHEIVVFRRHILPRAVRDSLAIVRELLPHLTVESIVIEYTFSYNGLLNSTIQAVQHPNPLGWYYFGLAVYGFILTLTLTGWVCRRLENYFAPPETEKLF